jgi:hypothetical protein
MLRNWRKEFVLCFLRILQNLFCSFFLLSFSIRAFSRAHPRQRERNAQLPIMLGDPFCNRLLKRRASMKALQLLKGRLAQMPHVVGRILFRKLPGGIGVKQSDDWFRPGYSPFLLTADKASITLSLVECRGAI